LAERLDYKQTIERIRLSSPHIIGITCMTFNLIDVINLLKEFKRFFPHIHLVVGGPHVNIFPKETLSLPYVDVVVNGEGEEVFPEVAYRLLNNISLDNLKGVGYKKSGEIFLNPERAVIKDLDGLTFPDRDLPFGNYFTVINKENKTAIMLSSRGCPYQCIYCDRPAMGKNFRARSAENVIKEVEECLSLGVKEIMFFDDTFTLNRQRVIDICNLINERQLKFNWSARARVDTVDLELLMLMKKAGCWRISYGIESGNDRILKILKKGISLDKIRWAIKNTKKVGIDILGDFIIGSPEESKEDILRTVDLAISLDLDYAQFTIMSLFPATEIYQMALKRDLISADVWQEFALNPKPDFNTPVWTESLTQKELEELLIIAYRRFYRRPKYFLKIIKRIRTLRELFIKAKIGWRVLTLKKFNSIKSNEYSIN
jgi:radical SAM superfamily enzyme YgiQ (UPF0313 family)